MYSRKRVQIDLHIPEHMPCAIGSEGKDHTDNWRGRGGHFFRVEHPVTWDGVRPIEKVTRYI
jgi:hypothetical protein